MKTATAFLAGITLVCAGCGDVAGPPASGIILSGAAGITDTIDALLPGQIHFQVLDDDGRPLGGARVQFHDVRDELGNPTPGPKVFATEGQLYATLDAVVNHQSDGDEVLTDANGRASAYLRLGDVAGDVYVKAVSGEHRDSVLFHALPGAAVALDALPADTAIGAGDSYELTVFAVDREGNRRPEAESNATIASAQPAVVRLAGPTVDAVSIGRAAIDLTSPTGTGRVYVAVVPDAVLALTVQPGEPVPEDVSILMTADGTTIESIAGIQSGSCPAWHPDGDRLLFDGLRIAEVGGGATQLSTGNTDLIAGCGRFSADGDWIYFDGRSSAEPRTASQVWRIRTDGTGLEQITAPPQTLYASGASSSPDGSRIAYTVRRASAYSELDYLVVHTLATGAVDTIVARGTYDLRASWSPTGEWIAYTFNPYEGPVYEYARKSFAFAETLALIRPDGTDEHEPPVATAPDDHYFLGSVNWSPNGEWVVGKSFYVSGSFVPKFQIKLINITTGETLPLNDATRSYRHPAWRPNH